MIRVIGDTKHPVKIWASDLEAEAEQQVRNLAELPFIFKHVAVMPDAHAGKGSAVGTVIATKGAIIPSCVGVDIGCFSGDTLVDLVDGTRRRLKDLSELNGEFWVYSITPDQQVVPAKATCSKTRNNASLIEVELDNGETVLCTPDHKFMLRSGEYCEAEKLIAGSSLMPFYSRADKEGYLLVRQPCSGKEEKFHTAIANLGVLGPKPSFPGQRTIVHHKNINPSDNRPENLEYMGDRDHSRHHRGIAERNKHWQSAEFEKARIESIRRKIKEDKVYLTFKQKIGRQNIKQYMLGRPEHFRKSVQNNGQRGRPYLEDYNKSDKGRRKSSEIARRKYPCEVCGTECIGGLGLHNHRKATHQFNHKVTSVRKSSKIEDVYCLVVPGLNNFALTAGVFVHNCGMSALKLPFKVDALGNLATLRHGIERAVPTGRHTNKALTASAERAFLSLGDISETGKAHIKRLEKTLSNAALAVGSLGGGNHFIEICTDTEGGAWIMLHSGSRNIGKCLAEVHIDRAKDLMKSYFIDLPDPDLAYLAQNTPQFKEYLHDLMWAQQFAKANRDEMMDRVLEQVFRHVYGNASGPGDEGGLFYLQNAKSRGLLEMRINCHHNYTAIENHYGQNVYVTRKGAVSAREGEWGIVPGSMGTRSFIVRGKGNAESFCSCSHGAGRKMSRTKARSTFTVEDLKAQTEGVECLKSDGVLDEIPASYKDIDVVMKNQADLVEPIYELKQLLCVKGAD